MENSKIVKDAVKATEAVVRTGMIQEQDGIIKSNLEIEPNEIVH